MRFAGPGPDRPRRGDRTVDVSLERNMKCAIGHCAATASSAPFLCAVDGPVCALVDRVEGRC
jgi:hypothetical protein